MKSKISITIESNFLKEIDQIIDNIYIKNRSQAIEHLIKSSLGENRTAVILCGGKENNLEIGKDQYRITAKIKKQTLVGNSIKKLRENGFKEIFIVARHVLLTKVFEILKEGKDYGVNLHYVEEKKSNGTYESLQLLKGKINGNFLIVYGDIYFDKINIEEIWNDHLKHNFIATIMLTTSSKPSEKGTVKVEGNKVLTFTQKPKISDIYLVFSPIIACSPEIFEYSGNSLERNVFPELAERGLLQGHLSSEKEIHIHSKEDIRKINKN